MKHSHFGHRPQPLYIAITLITLMDDHFKGFGGFNDNHICSIVLSNICIFLMLRAGEDGLYVWWSVASGGGAAVQLPCHLPGKAADLGLDL